MDLLFGVGEEFVARLEPRLGVVSLGCPSRTTVAMTAPAGSVISASVRPTAGGVRVE
ncbi:hypothetical protein ACFXMT_23555 [Streptomyces mirabilis]|uniref:hypothetical protein n=1 Tax=Streptomyces mirabilis TaxID=68239 RepID=UPI00369826BD